MQHYGLILADNGSNWYFGGAAFPRWPDGTFSQVITRVMRSRTGRVGVLVAWAWLGLHFFAK